MKVKKVIIEGFHNVVRAEYEFTEENYIHGRNGTGKSTILQAIQLGLLGYVPGTNKTKAGVFSHANNHTMTVTLILDDNGNEISVRRVWTRSKSSVTEIVDILPATMDIKQLVADIELPLFNFDEFSHMTANTLKNWFIEYLPKSEFYTDWNKELIVALGDMPVNAIDSSWVEDAVSEIESFKLSGVEEIRKANAHFKEELSFLKKELDRKTGTIQSLVYYDDYVPTYSEVELKKLIDATEQEILQVSKQQQVVDRIQTIKSSLEGLSGCQELLLQKQEQQDELNKQIDTTRASIKEKEAELYKLDNERNSLKRIIDSDGVCIFTQETCDKISALRDEYVEQQNKLIQEIKDVSSELSKLKGQLLSQNTQQHKLSAEIYNLTSDVTKYDMLSNELAELPTDFISSENIGDLNLKLEQYKDMYGKALANRQYNELNDVIVSDKYRIENQIECLKAWIKLTDVNGLQAKEEDNPFDHLADGVDRVLQQLFNSDKVFCKFNAIGKANSFSFGVDREGTYVPYSLLSSGEKCLFILALFIGLLEYTKSPMKLILIDDFLDHLDDENFSTVFQVLRDNTDIQFIFAGVKPISDSSCNVIEIS